MMEDYVSESDSDYTSYWRDWVSHHLVLDILPIAGIVVDNTHGFSPATMMDTAR
jgi:hypothetical protein